MHTYRSSPSSVDQMRNQLRGGGPEVAQTVCTFLRQALGNVDVLDTHAHTLSLFQYLCTNGSAGNDSALQLIVKQVL